jgi:hypothetical protein
MIADLGARLRIRDLVFKVVEIHDDDRTGAGFVCCALTRSTS